MIEVKRMAAQGDVLFRCIRALPAGAIEIRFAERLVVAHSETGHHHHAVGEEVHLFEKATRDPLVCYLRIDGDFADIVHDRSFHTHETLRLAPGIWEVRRQREWTGSTLWTAARNTMSMARAPMVTKTLTPTPTPTPEPTPTPTPILTPEATPSPRHEWSLVMD
jgi:hypothetical protein